MDSIFRNRCFRPCCLACFVLGLSRDSVSQLAPQWGYVWLADSRLGSTGFISG